MAKSKTLKVKDLSAHFFMNVNGNHIDVIYSDDMNNGAGLGAAFASAMEQDEELLKIISAAFITVLEAKEKDSSKKSNKLPKTPVKAVKKG
jgi:hypothetical protein